MSDENVTSTRTLRQRTSNPVVHTKGRRSLKLEPPVEQNVEELYRQVNAKADFNPTPLETIYESPKGKSHCLRDVMGVVKLKRHFRFTPYYNPSKCKIKMRKTKSKKLKRVGVNNPQGLQITFEQVEKALQYISEDENEENCQPEMVGKSTNSELIKKENNDTEQEEIVCVNPEGDAPIVVEMKDEEPVDELKMLEKRREEFLQFERDCDMLSPGKQIVDKTKRNKRRSGRVQPLCLSNIFSDTSLEHVDKKICNDTNINGISNDSYAMQVDKSTTCIEYEVTPTKTASTSTKLRNPSKSTTQRRPMRRNSGINRSIYKNSYVNSLSPDSQVLDVSINSEVESHFSKRLLSPTTLLDQLSLCSPEPISKVDAKRARRKSARLSLGGDKKPHLGSMWLESRSPKTETLNESLFQPNYKPAMPDNADIVEHCLEVDIPSENGVDGKVDAESRIDQMGVDAFGSNDSPLLSAIFDCQARLSKDRKFQISKGSKIHLSHFLSS